MAQEAYGFSEPAMREVLRRLDEHDKTYDMIRRRLATFAVRRHEAVYMPGANPVRLVTCNSSFYRGAFGGAFGDYDLVTSGGLVESYGNYVAGTTNVKRTVYPTQSTVLELNSDNQLVAGSELLQVYNPGSLPLPNGQIYFATKDQTSSNGYYFISGQPHDFYMHAFGCRYGKANTWTVGFTEVKFVKEGVWTNDTGNSFNQQEIVHAPNTAHDLFITHPGTWEVTFGITLSSAGAEDDTVTDSGTNTHTALNPIYGEFGLFKNFDPDDGNLATQWAGTPSNLTRVSFGIPTPDSAVTIERTVLLSCPLADWHGGPYTRLSLAVEAIQVVGDTGDALTYDKAWIHVRPIGDATTGFGGSGYNQFLGTSGAFQWYGGGPEPEYFDEDGVWIP